MAGVKLIDFDMNTGEVRAQRDRAEFPEIVEARAKNRLGGQTGFLLSMVVAWPLAHFVEAPIRKQKVLKGRQFAIAWASVAALIVPAAAGGIGVAVGIAAFVESELAAGTLVAPFAFRRRSNRHFHVVARTGGANGRAVGRYRQAWLDMTLKLAIKKK